MPKVGDVAAAAASGPSRWRTWSRTPARPGTGTGCTTTPRSPRRRSARPGRRRPGVRRAVRGAGAGLARARRASCASCRSRSGTSMFAGRDGPLRRARSRRSRTTGSTVDLTATILGDERPGRALSGPAPWCCSASSTGRAPRDRGRDRRRGRVRPRRHRTGRSSTLQAQAVTRALADAGLTLRRRRRARHHRRRAVLDHAARRLPRRCGRGGRTRRSPAARRSRCIVARAAQAIAAGQADVVVISFASNQRSARSRSLGGVLEDAHAGGAVRDAVRPAVPAVVLRDGGAGQYLHRYGGTPRAARRGRRRRPGVGAAEPGRLPPRRRPADRRRRARRADDVEPAHRRRLLPGHRRRRSGRAHLARAGARPAARRRSRCSATASARPTRR